MITYPEAKYLKAMGANIDVKVTIKTVANYPVIYIRDAEHFTFRGALHHIQQIAENEMAPQPETDEAVS